MNDKTLLIAFVFFLFVVFLLNNFSISGKQTFDVSRRFCRDSDGGIDIYNAGHVESDIATLYDRCLIGETYVSFVGRVTDDKGVMSIREYYCGEGRHGGQYQVYNKVIQCDEGDMCVKDVDGKSDACVKAQVKDVLE